MKKLFVLIAAMMMAVGVSAAQTEIVTLTFDNIEAWNSAPQYVGEQWAGKGILFRPLSLIGLDGQDGGLYDTGMLAGLSVNGSQYISISTSQRREQQ